MVASVLRNNLEARKVFTIGSFVNQQNSWLYFFFLPVAEVTSSLPVIHSPFFPSNPILVLFEVALCRAKRLHLSASYAARAKFWPVDI